MLGVYELPLNPAEPVVCLDEKPVSLHDEVRAPRPATPGHIAKRDSEYIRCGTANVFCAVEPKAGRHFTFPTPDRSADQFAMALFEVAIRYPEADTIHLIMDNLNTHCRKSLVGFYGEEFGGMLWDRFTVHYTPKHGSWLNQAEIEISLFARQCLGRRRIASLSELKREARAWNRQMNQSKTKINWRFTRKDARKKFGYKSKRSTRSETYSGPFHVNYPAITCLDPFPLHAACCLDGVNCDYCPPGGACLCYSVLTVTDTGEPCGSGCSVRLVEFYCHTYPFGWWQCYACWCLV